MQTITVNWLRARKACFGQVVLFEETFGDSVELTCANLRRAAEVQLDLGWLAVRLLEGEALAAFNAAEWLAWSTYRDAVRPADVVYRDSFDAALHEKAVAYEAAANAHPGDRNALGLARNAFDVAYEAATAVYAAATQAARAVRELAIADALADALDLPND
jgi:hypothetical protein